jgi:hypothetical protein
MAVNSGGADPRDALSPQQRRALRLLARGHSPDDVARAVRQSAERIKRWMSTPAFRDAVDRERVDPSDAPRLSGAAEAIREAMNSPHYKVPGTVSARRSLAIDLLVAGVPIIEAAEASGYSRQHLSSLVHHDATFARELARRTKEADQRRSNRLWAIWDRSADSVERSIEEGDPQIAWNVFKLGAPGVTDVTYRDVPPMPLDAPVLPPPPPSIPTDAPSPEGIECASCGRRFKSKAALTRHFRAEHEGA